MKNYFLSIILLLAFGSITVEAQESQIKFIPIEHATLIIEYQNKYIFVDPAEIAEEFKNYPSPDIILITHFHPDHFNPETINAIKNDKTIVIGNKASIDKLNYGLFLLNGENRTIDSINIEAIPAYNLTADRMMYHQKGEGNGYVITMGNEKIYLSGDTEDIREMRALKDIDHAFICMNLPFTMTPEQAASAVIDFKPKNVYPYHFNKKEYPANIETFTKLVNNGCSSKVIMLDWKETHD